MLSGIFRLSPKFKDRKCRSDTIERVESFRIRENSNLNIEVGFGDTSSVWRRSRKMQAPLYRIYRKSGRLTILLSEDISKEREIGATSVALARALTPRKANILWTCILLIWTTIVCSTVFWGLINTPLSNSGYIGLIFWIAALPFLYPVYRLFSRTMEKRKLRIIASLKGFYPSVFLIEEALEAAGEKFTSGNSLFGILWKSEAKRYPVEIVNGIIRY